MKHAHVWLGDRRRIVGLLALLVAAGAAATAPRADSWIGSWKQALDAGAGATVFVGPTAAGAACLAYARLRGSAMDDIVFQSRRDWLRWLQPLLAVWGVASLALVAVTIAATSAASSQGVPASPLLFWILVPACGLLGGQAAIGAAIGHASARAWAAPAAVVLVFLLFLWTTVGPLPDFFDTGGATSSLAGMTYRFWPTASVGIAALALAAWVLGLSHRRLFLSGGGRRLVMLGAVVTWVASWWFTPGDSGDRLARIADPPLACAGAHPQVCVLDDVRRPLGDLAGKVDRQAAALRNLDVPLPGRFVQSDDAPPGAGDGLVVLLDEDVRTTVHVDRATDTLVHPAACAADFGDEPPYLLFEARQLLGRWLQVQAGLLRPGPDDADRPWLTGDRSTRDAWVRITYGQLANCQVEAIRMPDGLG